MTKAGASCKTVRDIAPVWTLRALQKPTALSKKKKKNAANIALDSSYNIFLKVNATPAPCKI